jgi:hypothetical protein
MISKECPLVLKQLYEYDVVACHYNILKGLNWDVSNIPIDDKLERNITIGKLQAQYPQLKSYLKTLTNGVLDHYIRKNNIEQKDIIVREKDGIITQVPMNINDDTILLDFKHTISKLIIAPNRKTYLKITDEGKYEIKGMANKPVDCSFYDLLTKLNFTDKNKLIIGLEKLRTLYLKSNKIEWFLIKIPAGYKIKLKGNNELIINSLNIKYLDVDELDKEEFWKTYVWPFVESILIDLR